jgi:uncharacterized protein YciI
MQFVVLGYDAKDDKALNRRMAVRENHLKLAKENHENGHLLYAAGLLDENGQMIGSNMIMEFVSRAALDNYLENEPYVKGKVWEEVDVFPALVPNFCIDKDN